METYFDIIPTELTYIIVSKLPFSLRLYGMIRYFKLDEQIIFRLLSINLFNFLSRFGVNIDYRGRYILWRSIYEGLINLRGRWIPAAPPVEKSTFTEIVDIYDNAVVLIDGNQELFILFLYDYIKLSKKTSDQNSLTLLLRYETVILDELIAFLQDYASGQFSEDWLSEEVLSTESPLIGCYKEDLVTVYNNYKYHIEIYPKINKDTTIGLIGDYFLYKPGNILLKYENSGYKAIAVRVSGIDRKNKAIIQDHIAIIRCVYVLIIRYTNDSVYQK